MILRVFAERKIPSWLAMALLIGLGAIVFWPALTTRFFLDDYLQSAMVQGRFPGVRGPFDLYDFVADDNRQALFDRGFLPWWTDPHLTLRFLRPLSSALLYYEHRWIGDHPLLMHLHSFGWWILAVFAARDLFHRLVSPRAAAFATFIFALAPCHALPIGWLANREELIAIAFGTVGLSALLRWQAQAQAQAQEQAQEQGRERGWRRGWGWGALSVVAFSVALLAGEYALGCAGFVLAFAWRVPSGSPRRWSSLLFFAIPATAYLVVRHRLGYGAESSGFYQDPFRDTWLFVRHIPWRFGALVLFGWFSIDAATWRWADADWPAGAVVVLLLLVGGAALRHVAMQQSAAVRRTLVSLVLAAFLAMVPVLAVLPSVRLLGVAMLGIAPVIGVVLETVWFGRETEAQHGVEEWTAIAGTLLGFAHLVHGPGRGFIEARQIRTYAIEFAEHTSELAARIRGQESPEVIVVRGLDDVFFYGFAIEALGISNTRWVVLSHTGHVLCRREDATSIELLTAVDAALYPASVGDLYRSELHPLHAREVFTSGGLTATVREMDPSGPRKVRYTLQEDLDDPRWTWVGESRERGFYDASPPKVGFGTPLDP